MAIDFECSGCGRRLSAPDDLAGRRCRCKSCGTLMQIPEILELAASTDGREEESVPTAFEDKANVTAAGREPAIESSLERAEDMPEPATHATQTYVEYCKLLGDETRARILLELAGGPRNVSSLVEALDLTQPTASHHLGLLRARTLVASKRQGKSVVYELNRERMRDLIEFLQRLV